ncbi:MAG TPA: cobalamin-independent methionine synthase II family protein [Candidatus Binataceae bacterium]|nr:cobalamin-independent methionine synthase II family protein [Candidatus Binataceae bacterium]
MPNAENQILTTHAGSLPRSKRLAEMLGRKSRHEPVDEGLLEQMTAESTARVIARQLECGIDIGNNGEQARESFFTYVQHRMTGFSGKSQRPVMSDLRRYPSYFELLRDRTRANVDLLHAPQATGEVRYIGLDAVKKECADFRRALDAQKSRFVEPFMTSASPGIIAAAMLNAHYASLADYIAALGTALRTEYETIVNSGFVLQIDAPDLAMERHTSFAGKPLKEFLIFVDEVITAINRAIDGLPKEKVRLHVCWGNYEGPHTDDVALDEIAEHLYRAEVSALLLSMANPRHEHEYRSLKSHPLPESMKLIVGAIDSTTNYVEHPEVVADRIERAAHAVGDPRRIMAGTDCGFDTSAGFGMVAEELVWEKLRALSEGAAIATHRLFG